MTLPPRSRTSPASPGATLAVALADDTQLEAGSRRARPCVAIVSASSPVVVAQAVPPSVSP